MLCTPAGLLGLKTNCTPAIFRLNCCGPVKVSFDLPNIDLWAVVITPSPRKFSTADFEANTLGFVQNPGAPFLFAENDFLIPEQEEEDEGVDVFYPCSSVGGGETVFPFARHGYTLEHEVPSWVTPTPCQSLGKLVGHIERSSVTRPLSSHHPMAEREDFVSVGLCEAVA